MKLHDGEGLYLGVFANGRKHWRFRRRADGKERLLALGQYPHVSLAEARKRRDKMQSQREHDLDPSAERMVETQRKRIADANSFEAVAKEWYGKQVHVWGASHIRDVKRRLEGNIFPILGQRSFAEIEAPELLAAIRKIESRGSYDLAHRVLQVCGQVFRYGIATGRCSRDLSKDLYGALTPHLKQHQAAVRPEELPALMRAIVGYDRLGSSQPSPAGAATAGADLCANGRIDWRDMGRVQIGRESLGNSGGAHEEAGGTHRTAGNADSCAA